MQFFQDLRYGLRMLLRRPAFTVAAVLAIALGIGANTAIFSVVNGILFRPLPYPSSDRLAMIFMASPQQNQFRGPLSSADFMDWRTGNRAFESVAVYSRSGFNITGDEGAESINGAIVTPGFFEVLGIQPLLGRTFLASEESPGSERSVVISHSLWRRRFKEDPSIVGKPIMMGVPHTIIGVMPPGFAFPRQTDEVWRNAVMGPTAQRGPYLFWGMGRLKTGLTLEQAQADVTAIAERLEQEHPRENLGVGLRVVALKEYLVGDVRTQLYMLLGAVAFVLLIACANVANLLLARGTGRQKEIAVRTALGAGRLRLVRQLVTESMVLAVVSGILGFGLSVWGLDILKSLAPESIPRLHDVRIDPQVLAYTTLLSIVCGILFGLIPAFQISSSSLNVSLKEGGRSSSDHGSRRKLRRLLIVSEFALSLMLLAGAGLLIRSFVRLQNVDAGFNPENVLAIRATPTSAKYTTPESVETFYSALLARIEAVPSVTSVALSNNLPPILPEVSDSFTVEGRPPEIGGNQPMASVLFVTSSYFDALQIPIARGRNFTAEDRLNAPGVALVNESLARRYFAGEEPIGRRFKVGDTERRTPWMEIVGIVRDVKYDGLETPAEPAYYLPHSQWPRRGHWLIIRTASDPNSVIPHVKEHLAALDKDIPIARITTLADWTSQAVAQQRFRTALLGLFAAIAMVLAAIGIYGVMAYSVSLRTREIGIRMALGASRSEVLKMVICEGLVLAAAGIATGLAGALALTGTIATLLFDVTPTDPVTFLAVSGVLAAVAAVACYVPARRAMRVDPMVALRYE